MPHEEPKSFRLCTALALFTSAWITYGQQVPPGVRYKKAPAAVNQKAADFLSRLIAGKLVNADLTKVSSKVIVCGPGLWAAIKGVAPRVLRDAMPITWKVPSKKGVQTLYSKGFKTAAQQKAFWELFGLYLDKYRLLPKYQPKTPPRIRKANADELNYYWAMIAYDIEEPLYIITIGKQALLFHFAVEMGQPKVFTIEFVGKIVP